MMRFPSPPSSQRPGAQRGFALIAVLWLVAALSVMVAGLTQTVKSEFRSTSFSRQSLQATALGESAIQLALQEMVMSGQPPEKLIVAPVPVGGQTVDVQMIPMNGYIDINRAPVELLQALFQFAGGLDQGAAASVAALIESARTVPGPSGRPPGFEASEDLLLLPGMDYPLYARVAPLITTEAGGSGGVNVRAAPAGVLAVLSGGNEATVSNYLQARSEDNATADTSQMNGAWVDAGSQSNTVEFTARVRLPDGDAIMVIRRYTITPNSADGLPWRAFYATSRVESAPMPKP